jgi:hypothetical protein
MLQVISALIRILISAQKNTIILFHKIIIKQEISTGNGGVAKITLHFKNILTSFYLQYIYLQAC